MSSKKSTPASAWEDDWEAIADKQYETDAKTDAAPPVKLSKAERRAKHAEFNRQIWESAENPEPMLFLETKNDTPAPAPFKPAVTLLARKPPPQLLSRNGPTAGMAGLSLDDDDDSEEERRKKNEADFAERKARAQKERADKERRYAEAREKIFGSPAVSDESRGASPSKPSRAKGRGRGGQSRSSNEQSPARLPAARQLYDPSYSPKPGYIPQKDANRPATPNGQEKPIREPRGPQSSVRGGRGFAPRGNHHGFSESTLPSGVTPS